MATTVKVYNQEGKEVGQAKLDPQIFAVPIKEPVVQQVVVGQLANARLNLAHTKTRGDVRGGGKKPWRQKGTGRARHGSTRSPIWRGGGVTFGPNKYRNYSLKINKSTKRLATKMVLTDKAQNKAIVVLDQLTLADYKTKELVKILQKLPVKNKSSLLILPKADDKINRSARNLKETNTILADSLNVVALLKYDWLIIIKESLKKISATYGK